MYGSIIGGTDVTIAVCTAASLVLHMIVVCTAVPLVVQMIAVCMAVSLVVHSGGTDDSGMYGSIIGGTDVTIAVCTAVSLVAQM